MAEGEKSEANRRIRSVYLAYPIDASDGGAWLAIAQDLEAGLVSAEIAVYRPGDAWAVAKETQPHGVIAAVNNAAVDSCDALIAILPEGVQTVGVPIEIGRALAAGKPVAILGGQRHWALYDTGSLVRPLLLRCDYEGAADALRWAQIVEITDGAPEFERMRVRIDADGRMPTRTYPDDAGFDLYTSQTTEIPPGEFVDVPCGVRVQLPEWTWAMITGRSSTLRKRGLLVNQGIIDPGWRGNLFIGVWNLTGKPVTVEVGERIGQLIVLANTTRLIEAVEVTRLDDHPRGERGFGSSGR